MASVERWKPKANDPKRRPRYRARWRDPDGRQQTRVFDRKVDADQFLATVEHRKLVGEYVDPNAGRVTLREYAEAWRARQVHRPATQELVESRLRLHVYPALGDRQLRTIRPSDVQALVTDRASVVSPRTVETMYRYLHSILRDAERDRLISRSPCDGIKLPRATKVEIVPPTVDEVAALSEAIAPRYRATISVAAGAGLRLGEVLGLQVDRIDFLRRQLRVDQQLLSPNSGPVHLGPPKTPSSVRTVPLADVVLEALAEHVRHLDPVDGFVFTTELDNPVRKSTFQAAWARANRDAGVKVRFHDLRHFYASALIAAGCSVKAVQHALGHASATETLDTYAHLWPSDEDQTRGAIQAVLSPGCVTDVSRTQATTPN